MHFDKLNVANLFAFETASFIFSIDTEIVRFIIKSNIATRKFLRHLSSLISGLHRSDPFTNLNT